VLRGLATPLLEGAKERRERRERGERGERGEREESLGAKNIQRHKETKFSKVNVPVHECCKSHYILTFPEFLTCSDAKTVSTASCAHSARRQGRLLRAIVRSTLCVCARARVCARAHVCMCVSIQTHTYTYIYISIIHAHTHTHTHKYIRIYVYTYI
jgi:hypothetical protein